MTFFPFSRIPIPRPITIADEICLRRRAAPRLKYFARAHCYKIQQSRALLHAGLYRPRWGNIFRRCRVNYSLIENRGRGGFCRALLVQFEWDGRQKAKRGTGRIRFGVCGNRCARFSIRARRQRRAVFDVTETSNETADENVIYSAFNFVYARVLVWILMLDCDTCG